MAKSKIETVNEFVDVRDINGDVLYTKSGYIFRYIRLMPIKISLLSDKEKERTTSILSSEFKNEKDPFCIMKLPRPADIDDYLQFLNERYEQELNSSVRRNILKILIEQASSDILSGKNYEHQCFLRIWEKENVRNAEKKLLERAINFSKYYESIGNETKILNTTDIIKLCNLHANGAVATMESYDDDNKYEKIPTMKGV